MTERLRDPVLAEELARLPGWTRRGDAITRAYRFGDFKQAIFFVNGVAALAETADHHPDIDIRYNEVTLTLSTHSAGGLTAKDMALAHKIDATLLVPARSA